MQKRVIKRLPVSELDRLAFYSPVFVVPKPDGHFRFFFNLKALNEYVDAPHFKMEGLHLLPSLLFKGAYMCKLDLKDAYYAVLIDPAFRHWLRFTFEGDLFEIFDSSDGPSVFSFCIYKAFETDSGLFTVTRIYGDCIY